MTRLFACSDNCPQMVPHDPKLIGRGYLLFLPTCNDCRWLIWLKVACNSASHENYCYNHRHPRQYSFPITFPSVHSNIHCGNYALYWNCYLLRLSKHGRWSTIFVHTGSLELSYHCQNKNYRYTTSEILLTNVSRNSLCSWALLLPCLKQLAAQFPVSPFTKQF